MITKYIILYDHLNLVIFLIEEVSKFSDDEFGPTTMTMNAWNHNDYVCKNYILNRLKTYYMMCIVQPGVKMHFKNLLTKS